MYLRIDELYIKEEKIITVDLSFESVTIVLSGVDGEFGYNGVGDVGTIVYNWNGDRGKKLSEILRTGYLSNKTILDIDLGV